MHMCTVIIICANDTDFSMQALFHAEYAFYLFGEYIYLLCAVYHMCGCACVFRIHTYNIRIHYIGTCVS